MHTLSWFPIIEYMDLGNLSVYCHIAVGGAKGQFCTITALLE